MELSSGQTAHLYQLFVERDETKRMPSVQELFEQSFLTSGVKLKSVPSVMILQMPRFGRQFKVYDRILPSQLLDVTDVIENGKLLTYSTNLQKKNNDIIFSSKTMYCLRTISSLGVQRVLWKSQLRSGQHCLLRDLSCKGT